MYVVNKSYINNNTLIEINDILLLKGFLLPSKDNYFKIKNNNISNIIITDKRLIHSIIYKKVNKKYLKLIKLLNKYLESDDDGDDSFNKCLDEMEKFRIEIKEKYRKYLLKEELESMSYNLKNYKKLLIDKNNTKSINSILNGRRR